MWNNANAKLRIMFLKSYIFEIRVLSFRLHVSLDPSSSSWESQIALPTLSPWKFQLAKNLKNSHLHFPFCDSRIYGTKRL